VIYGHLAEVMLSQPATKIFLKTTEPNASEWVSRAIGRVEVERVKETRYDGSRTGKNFTVDRQIEPLVLDSEISGLEDLHAYLKYGNYVTRFSFPVLQVPKSGEGVVNRLKDDYIVRNGSKEQSEEVKNEALPATTMTPSTKAETVRAPVTKPAMEPREPEQTEFNFGSRI
jgi:hypothetical protein